jgi:predicted Zn-dependent protease
VFGLRLRVYILAALLTQFLPRVANAQTETPENPSEQTPESQRADGGAGIDANKLKKYDVERIGQRGIGRGFNIYSLRREHELGQSLAASFDRSTKIIHDELVNDYINRLAQKIVRYSDADVAFTVRVIDSGDIPRAYGLPGGFLYVDSALILASDGEAELAAVLAHEIAHVAARHATRALTRKRLCSVVDSLAMMTGPAGAGLADVGGIAGPLSVKKFSRDAEYEADLLGVEYAYVAGYDPRALLDALEKLHAIEADRNAAMAKIPGYHLASHLPFKTKIARGFANYPLTEERISRLASEIAAFLPNRKDYILDTNDFQEVKSRLLASQAPLLRRHGSADSDSKGPVLRRDTQPSSDVRSFSISTFRSE